MDRIKQHLALLAFAGLLAATLACGLPGGGEPAADEAPGEAPTKGAAPPPATEEAPSGGGELSQWASTATASSEYSSPSWSAMQATGAPDTWECDDLETAWATETATGVDWLEVGFDTPVYPTRIDIRETNSPGFIVRVEVKDASGQYREVWQGQPRAATECPRVFTVPVTGIQSRVAVVRIHLDQREGGSWNEIDAVQLVGKP